MEQIKNDMKSNEDILNEFGKKIIEGCIDPALGNLLSLRKKENPPILFKEYTELFKKLDDNDFKILKKYLAESLGGLTFNILRVFEENEQFKISYDNDGHQINLLEISEDLKAEPIIENGWIQRFSKELNNETT